MSPREVIEQEDGSKKMAADPRDCAFVDCDCILTDIV